MFVTFEEKSNTLRIRGELNFSTIPMIWQESVFFLKKNKVGFIDFSEVKKSSSAGLALIIEYIHYHSELKIVHLPKQMIDIAKAMGIKEFILQYVSSENEKN